jgi:hypothetical protein
MKSIKAIVLGILFVLVVILLLQLAYIFIAVGYNALAKSYPYLHEISGIFRYLVGIPVFVVIMFIGGYITADIAGKKVLLHTLAVGVLTSGGMIIPTLEYANLTMTGVVVFILAVGGSVAGGWRWQKANKVAWRE